MQLRDYQSAQLAFHLANVRSLNRSEPGTGKTPVFCSLIKFVWDLESRRTVLINPKSISRKNKDEVLDWTGFAEDEVLIVGGTPANRKKIYANPKAKVLIMGADTFGKEWQLLGAQFTNLIVDESHTAYSSHTSQRTQNLYKASKKFERILFCTGTPVSQRYSSVYPMAALFHPTYYGNYNRFLNLHRVTNTLGYTVGWKNPEPISRFLGRYSVGIRFADAYKNATETMIFEETCDMSPKMEKAYSEMEEAAMVELEDRYLEAGSPGVQAIRCRQILSCPEIFGIESEENGKDELLKTHLERVLDNGYSLLIFSSFVAEQERILKICREMGISAEILNGSVSQLKRGDIDKRFRSGVTKVVIGTPAVCSFGYNWEHVSEIIFCSCSYSDSDFEQGIARGNRGTRKSSLPVYILKYSCRVEKRIWEVIRRKQKENNSVMEKLK